MAFGFAFDNGTDTNIGVGSITSSQQERYEIFDIYEIRENEKNEYSTEGIESLAFSILHTGLQQQLVVRIENGKPVLLTGHRRLLALKHIVKSKMPGYEKYQRVRCQVNEPKNINLPLTDEQKELFSIYTTNSEARNKSNADLINEAKVLSGIYSDLIKAGVELTTEQRELLGNVSSERAFIAEKLNISQAQGSRIMGINKKAIPEIQEAVKNEDLTIEEAYKVSSKPVVEQEKVVRAINVAKRAEEERTESGDTVAVPERKKIDIKETIDNLDGAKKEEKIIEVSKDEIEDMLLEVYDLESVISKIGIVKESNLIKIKKEIKKLEKIKEKIIKLNE